MWEHVCREECTTLLCSHIGIFSLYPHETPWPEAADSLLLSWEVLTPRLSLLPGSIKTKPFHHTQHKFHCGCSQNLFPAWTWLSLCCFGDDGRLGAWPGCSLFLQFALHSLQPLDDFLIRVASLNCSPHADSSIIHASHCCTDHSHWSCLACSAPGCPSAP